LSKINKGKERERGRERAGGREGGRKEGGKEERKDLKQISHEFTIFKVLTQRL
jgi:hypothetical protein